MKQALIECVPNVSEGRDAAAIRSLVESVAKVAGVAVLHVTSDADHHRSVITFAGPRSAVEEAAFQLASRALECIDLRQHSGVHPRIGALDVLPFVPLEGATLAMCADTARRVGQRIWQELQVPVYFYEAAATSPERRQLESVRRGGFEAPQAAPDLGGPQLHPSAGATIVGARPFLIAFNINLRTSDVTVAKSIARRIRTSSGGLPAVKALGLALESRGLVQVSMNLTDFETTPVEAVYRKVERLAGEHGVSVEESELIGLIPQRALEQTAAAFLRLREFDSQRVIENKLRAVLEDFETPAVRQR